MGIEFEKLAGFEWDQGNIDKNLIKHNLENWECEQLFFNDPLIVLNDPKHSIAENRFAAFGKTDDGRLLVVIFTIRSRLIRVISARKMNRKERNFYEENQ
jgi:uncharacterized DUF497 family protein